MNAKRGINAEYMGTATESSEWSLRNPKSERKQNAMFAESVASIPSMWASVNSWFTPTIFFVVLNLTIATIYITSSLAASKHADDHHHQHPQLVRSPSVLQRLKSINFYAHGSQQPTTAFAPQSPDFTDPPNFTDHDHGHSPSRSIFSRSPSMLQRLKSINLYGYASPPEETVTVAEPEPEPEPETHLEKLRDGPAAAAEGEFEEVPRGGQVSRTKSDTQPASGELPPRLPRKMRKSASVKSAFSHFEEEEIVEVRRPATVREGKVTAAEEAADEEVDAKADDFINKFKQQLKLQRVDSIIRYKEMIDRGSSR